MASIFKGFLLKTSLGYLTPSEQDDLFRYILGRVRLYPRAAREIQAVLAEELDSADLSPNTLAVLRKLTQEWKEQRRNTKERG